MILADSFGCTLDQTPISEEMIDECISLASALNVPHSYDMYSIMAYCEKLYIYYEELITFLNTYKNFSQNVKQGDLQRIPKSVWYVPLRHICKTAKYNVSG